MSYFVTYIIYQYIFDPFSILMLNLLLYYTCAYILYSHRWSNRNEKFQALKSNSILTFVLGYVNFGRRFIQKPLKRTWRVVKWRYAPGGCGARGRWGMGSNGLWEEEKRRGSSIYVSIGTLTQHYRNNVDALFFSSFSFCTTTA